MTQNHLASYAEPNRRGLLRVSLLGGLAAATATRGGAQQAAPAPLLPARPIPVVEARFPHEIAPGVFLLPDRRIPLVSNIGIVVGRNSVLVVDCGMDTGSAEKVLALARRLAPGRQVILTVTHAHPEHGFGARVFKGAGRIWYSRLQADYLARDGRRLLEGFRSGVLSPDLRPLLDDVVITPPDQTYDGERAQIDLGGKRVELRTWGTAHTPGDQIVHLPDDGIVFAGDLIEERMFPIIPFFPPMITAADIDVVRWERVLGDIAAMRPKVIVPGHGNLGGAEIATEVRTYLREVRTLAQAGSPDAARIRATRPTWENPEFIAPALAYFAQAGS